ncbi:MAG: SIMPL domain-containing protein [Pseudomonadota bacterium]
MRYLLLALLLAIPSARAEEAPTYHRIDFQSEAGQEIANDLLLAQLSTEVNADNPTEVARQLNTSLNSALKKAASYHTVKTSSGNQQTFPLYGKNHRLEGWRGHAELRIESRDFKAATELIAQLQASMQLTGLQFALAPETRKQTENELIGSALGAFKQRAEAIRTALGARGYKLVRLAINPGFDAAPLVMSRKGAMLSDAAPPTPELAGGESRISVQISGTIELIP